MIRRVARVLLDDGRRAYADATDGIALYDRAPWLGGEPTGERVDAARVTRRLVPVAPSKIVCVGRNYAAHAKELGNEVPEEPLLFLKPPSALLDPGADIVLPPGRLSKRVEHEVELGVVVGQRLTRASEAACREAFFGFTVVGDITARDLQKSDKQWTRGKGLDTFCPVGPEIVRGLDISDVGVRCLVNGALRQDGRTSQMIFSPAALVAFISDAMTLEPGDLIVTGTPAGVGPLASGDRVRMEIDGIGALEVGVRACPE
jgi:2-keto-4-pentenoate hydratase/2-oxohepta-3-ene-1,7-dioic acid hydratase in catechol pathway